LDWDWRRIGIGSYVGENSFGLSRGMLLFQQDRHREQLKSFLLRTSWETTKVFVLTGDAGVPASTLLVGPFSACKSGASFSIALL